MSLADSRWHESNIVVLENRLHDDEIALNRRYRPLSQRHWEHIESGDTRRRDESLVPSVEPSVRRSPLAPFRQIKSLVRHANPGNRTFFSIPTPGSNPEVQLLN